MPAAALGSVATFYDFAEMWVDLDDYGNPLRIPTLPKWALPAGMVPKAEPAPAVSAARSQPSTAKTTENVKPAASWLDAGLTQRIESFRQVVGDALYFEVFRRGGPARNACELPAWMLNAGW